jgi:nucleoside-diphosphate-sugar epimerase
VRPRGDRWRLAASGALVVDLDLEDPHEVQSVVRHLRPLWIFSVAAHGCYSWQTDRARMERVNVEAVDALLDAAGAAGTERLVHAGTSSEYGFKDHAPGEAEPVEPTTDYAVTKAAGTALVTNAGRGHLETVVLRVYSAYGPREESARLIPTLLLAALEGSLPPLVDPNVARDFVYVDDVVEAFMRAARLPLESGSIFNVASGTQTSIGDLVQIVRELFGVTVEAAWNTMPSRTWDTSTWVGNPETIHRELGWLPRVGLADGLRHTAEWLKANPYPASRDGDVLGRT